MAATHLWFVHDFQRLEVWQRARRFFVAIDRRTRQFPRSDRGVVARQLRRAAFAIPSNISEGCGKRSVPELLRFLDIAAASVSEAESQLIIAIDLGYVDVRSGASLQSEVTTIRRMLYRLIEYFEERDQDPEV